MSEGNHRERMASDTAGLDTMEKKLGEKRAGHEAKLKEAVMEVDLVVREVERDMRDEQEDAERRER